MSFMSALPENSRLPEKPPGPDAGFDGYSFWPGKLNDFSDDYITAEMVKAFIASTEYMDRFGSRL